MTKPTQLTLELQGKEYVIKKMPLGKYGRVLEELDNLPPEVSKTLAELDTTGSEALLGKLPALLGKSWPNIMAILEVSTGIDRKTIEEDLDLADGIELLKAVFEVNDFTAVKKALSGLFGAKKPAIKV